MRRAVPAALAAMPLLLGACGTGGGAEALHRPNAPHVRTQAIGQPVTPRPAEVMGIPGTAELRVEDPAEPASPDRLVTLGRSVTREPRDVCFGTYLANESPEEGDLFCQVRGRLPLTLTLGHDYLPGSPSLRRPTTIWGQANRDVTSMELIDAGQPQRTALPLSVHRMFLIAFSPSARGTMRLVAHLANGTAFGHTFSLPLTQPEAGSWPRVTRRGAVSNGVPIGENIVSKSYRQLIRLLGPPLTASTKPNGGRCLYYDVIGHPNGWEFCFRGQTMTGASGNQAPPHGAGRATGGR